MRLERAHQSPPADRHRLGGSHRKRDEPGGWPEASWEAERRHLRLDGEPVILYSLLSPPGGARANLLNDLYRLDATMTVALEWRPWGLDSARRKIRGAQRHYFSKRYSMMAAHAGDRGHQLGDGR